MTRTHFLWPHENNTIVIIFCYYIYIVYYYITGIVYLVYARRIYSSVRRRAVHTHKRLNKRLNIVTRLIVFIPKKKKNHFLNSNKIFKILHLSMYYRVFVFSTPKHRALFGMCGLPISLSDLIEKQRINM